MSNRKALLSHPLVHLRLIGMAIVGEHRGRRGRILAQSLNPVTGAAARFMLASMLLAVWLLVVRGWPRLTVSVGCCRGGSDRGRLCLRAVLHDWLARRPRRPRVTGRHAQPSSDHADGWAIYGERLTLRIVAGIILATAGAVIALSHGNPFALLSGGFGWGEAVLLGCVLTWSIYSLLGKEILKSMDAMTFATLTTGMGAPLLVATALAVDGPALIQPTHGPGRRSVP